MIIQYRCVTNVEDIKEYLGKNRIVAFKFKTAPKPTYRNHKNADIDPAKADIVGCAFSVREGTGIYVPICHRIGQNIDPKEFFAFLGKFLTNKNVLKIAHDISFDASMAYAKGIVIQSHVYDTMCAAQLSYKSNYEFRKPEGVDLGSLACELLCELLPAIPTISQGGWFDDLAGDQYATVRCCAAEADYTLRLYYEFTDWFDKNLPSHKYITENIESPISIYRGIMSANGLPIDVDLMKQKSVEVTTELEKIHEKIKGFVGDVDVGTTCSTRALKNYLYNDLKLPNLNPTGNESGSINEKTLRLLKKWCESNRPQLASLFDLILLYRKLSKIKTTFVDGYMEHLNDTTGCIHPTFYSLSTSTGRMSCCDPNVQTMPRRSGDPVGVRNFIQAPEGELILSLDFSQVELRISTFYCRDETMLEIYRNNGDIHAMTTAIIYGISLEEAQDKHSEHYKERRATAKSINFGVLYGLYPRRLQEMLSVDGIEKNLDECKTIIDNIKRGYKDLAVWQNKIIKETEKKKYTESFIGRRRYLPDINSTEFAKKSSSERQALNHPIQATAADIMKLAMVRVLEGVSSRPWLKPLLQIHDELVFSVPEDKLEEAVSFVRGCMEEKPFDAFDVPLIAEACAGKRFGTMEEIDSY